jgi:hypothetical protein
MKQRSASCWCLVWIVLRPWRQRWHIPPKRRLIFKRTARCYITDDRTFHDYRCEKLIFRQFYVTVWKLTCCRLLRLVCCFQSHNWNENCNVASDIIYITEKGTTLFPPTTAKVAARVREWLIFLVSGFEVAAALPLETDTSPRLRRYSRILIHTRDAFPLLLLFIVWAICYKMF